MKRLALVFILVLVALTTDAATLDDLSWMAGHWRTNSGDAASEELWLNPEGELMVGLHRDIRPGKRAWFEFLRIEERDGAIAYVAQPGGKPPTSFPLVSIEPGKAVFENPDHDFPQRIIYWLDGGRLCARAEAIAEPGKGPQWCWEKK